VGVVLLVVLEAIPVVGGFVGFLVMLFGLGALFLTVFRRGGSGAGETGGAGGASAGGPRLQDSGV
jgi:hypothetical protein